MTEAAVAVMAVRDVNNGSSGGDHMEVMTACSGDRNGSTARSKRATRVTANVSCNSSSS